MSSNKIWLSSPHMGGSEQAYVNLAFETNWIAPLGPNVDGFEKDLMGFLGEEVHVCALSSGTAAIHLALVILGVGHGDEVLCQSLTFSASANPIVYQGAIPVFVDSEPDTWNMSPEHLERAIIDRIKHGKKPKAIIFVDLYGMPAKIDALVEISSRYDIPLIEDAAEALGSTFNGRKAGTFGDISILSFNGNKIITTSGGGALVSKNKSYVDKARFLATQAQDPAPHYQHSQIGYNYRMSNICAGIGRGQMEVLPERIMQRRRVFEFYGNKLHDAGFHFQTEPNDSYYSNHWLTVFTENASGPSREVIRLALGEMNIDSRPVWKPMHLQPVFDAYPYYGEGISDLIFQKGLCLPSGSNLSQEDLDFVANMIVSVKQKEVLI
jgi:dTDP-4-amino-4,6-dideoxygalactose transaminase